MNDIHTVFDVLHEDLLDVLLVKVSVQNRVSAGGGQANQVTDHVGGHQTFYSSNHGQWSTNHI